MRSVFLLSALIFAASVSVAAEQPHRAGACRADYEKFCKAAKPGEGQIVKCFKEHEAGLSSECKNRIAERKNVRKNQSKLNNP